MHPIAIQDKASKLELDLFNDLVPAGFASLMDGYKDKKLDINEYLIEYPASTFLVRVEGESMIGAGILSGDILVIDRSKNVVSGDIVLAVVNGEFTVKRFVKTSSVIKLVPENKEFTETVITSELEFTIWGKVVGSVRKY